MSLITNKNLKKLGVVAALGLTGIAVLGTINLYRLNRNMDLLSLDGENWW